MLKKAGIVLAATAAGLLAVSPLAFAGDYSSNDDYKGDCDSCGHSKEHHKYKEYHRDRDKGDNTVQSGLINLNNTGVQAPVQACGNSVNILSGAFGILGNAKNKSSNNTDCEQSNSSR